MRFSIYFTFFSFLVVHGSITNCVHGTPQDDEHENKRPEQACLEAFQTKALEMINFYRVRHQAQKVKLDPKVTRISQNFSEHLAQTKTFQHNKELKRLGLGENLSIRKQNKPITLSTKDCHNIAIQVVNHWYKEMKAYDFLRHRHKFQDKKVGHFTQMVWRGSKKLGLGLSSSSVKLKDGLFRLYVVANFSPRGNVHMRGHFARNVKPYAPIEKQEHESL